MQINEVGMDVGDSSRRAHGSELALDPVVARDDPLSRDQPSWLVGTDVDFSRLGLRYHGVVQQAETAQQHSSICLRSGSHHYARQDLLGTPISKLASDVGSSFCKLPDIVSSMLGYVSVKVGTLMGIRHDVGASSSAVDDVDREADWTGATDRMCTVSVHDVSPSSSILFESTSRLGPVMICPHGFALVARSQDIPVPVIGDENDVQTQDATQDKDVREMMKTEKMRAAARNIPTENGEFNL